MHASLPTVEGSPLDRARALQQLVRERAAEAERQVSPDVDVVRALSNAGLFSICVPTELGGAEADPWSTLRVIEAIAEADGSAGWVLMIGIETTGIGSAHFDDATARSVVTDHPSVVICGALNPVVTGKPVDGGYVVSGRWPFASGSQRADWFWGQCVVEGTQGEVVEVLVPRADYDVIETWNAPGLHGSGSHDVHVDHVFVPLSHVTRVREERPRVDRALFRLPLMSRLAYNKVGVATGIARGAIDHFIALASERSPRLSRGLMRERPRVQLAVAEAEAKLGGARGVRA